MANKGLGVTVSDDVNHLHERAARVGRMLTAQGLTLVTAESCTGGWIAKAITDVPGSSAWFDRGFITYSNTAKREMLAVRESTLQIHGAVSANVVMEMAEGALGHSRGDIAVAVSGIAGPDGGTAAKPVGTVWLAWLTRDKKIALSRCYRFGGGRESVRYQSVDAAFEVLLNEVRSDYK